MESHEFETDVTPTEELLVNRTGIMNNPELSAELIQGAKETVPTTEKDGVVLASKRAEYVMEGLPIGSPPVLVPEPESETEAQQALDEMAAGLPVLLDKLGERLAFERQGTRVYEALLQKLEALPVTAENGPSAEDLRHICDEELEHFKLLQKSIAEMGGDATVQTPSADVTAVLNHGIAQIVSDPRTTLAQSLQAVLTAELADNDGWKMLGQLAAQMGQKDLQKICRKAWEQEQEHLENVREWLLALTFEDAALDALAGAADEEVITSDDALETQAAPRPKKKSKSSSSRSSKRKRTKKK
jgi:rubrerythrin